MNAKRIENLANELGIINGNIDVLEAALNNSPIEYVIKIEKTKSIPDDKRLVPMQLSDSVTRKLAMELLEAYQGMKSGREKELEHEVLGKK